MKFLKLLVPVVTGLWLSSPLALDIDLGSAAQGPISVAGPGAADSTAVGSNLVGGERDYRIDHQAGVTATTIMDSDGSGFPRVQVSGVTTANTKSVFYTYDGPDGDATTLDATGLGGVDLTDAGASDTLRMQAIFGSITGTLTVTVYTDAGNASQFVRSSIVFPFITTWTMPFASFTPILGAGADFTNVGAIELQVDIDNGSVLSFAGLRSGRQMIDSISVSQPLIDLRNPPNPIGTAVGNTALPLVGNVIGEERDMKLLLLDSAGATDGATLEIFGDVVGSPLNILEFRVDAGARAEGVLDYDGADGDADNFDPVGLGGVDLTTLGQFTALRIRVPDATGLPQAIVEVHTDGSNASQAAIVFPNTAVATDFLIPFAAFQSISGTGADFTNVGAIRVRLLGEDATTLDITMIDVAGPVVAVTKTDAVLPANDADSDGLADPGDRLRYTITVTESGGGDTGVALTDILDTNAPMVAGTLSVTPIAVDDAYSTVQDTPLPVADGAGDLLDNDVDPDDNFPVVSPSSLTVDIPNSDTVSAQGGTVDYAAATDGSFLYTPPAGFIGVDSFDYQTIDDEGDTDTATAVIIVAAPAADLSITKTDDVDPILAGETLTYTITVNNAGPGPALGVEVTDTLPAGVTFVSTTGCNNDPNGVPTCELGTIASGGSKQFTVEVTVDIATSGMITNTASVTSLTTDPTPGNNSTTEDTDVTAFEADLSITKTDNIDPILAGQTLTYTVTVSNAGPAPASDVEVADTLPAGVTFVSTSGCNNDPAGVPTCQLGTIASGGSAMYTVQVTVDTSTSGMITNNVSVSTSTTDPAPGNNSASETTTVNPLEANLSITKTDSADPVLPGGTITYTITVNNAGPETAPNVVVTDTLPAGVTFVSTSGCAEDPNGVPSCTLGNIASGGSDMYTVQVTVDGGTTGTVTNSVSVASDIADPVAGNNTATEDTATVVPPTCTNDAYAATGNVGLDVNAANGVILGGTADTGTGISVSEVQGVGANVGNPTATTNSGSVTVAANGSFTYTPPAGSTIADTFTYTANNAGGSDTCTVTITPSDMIWFIDRGAPPAGANNGTLADPFLSLGAFELVNGTGGTNPAAGQCIYIEQNATAYTGPVTLENNQRLIGEGSSAAIPAACGITLATHSPTLPTTNGTDPVIANATGNGINLGTGNTVRGLTVGNTPGGSGISGGAVGNLAISESSISGSGGGIAITTSGAFGSNVTFDSLASSGPASGINLNSVSGTMGVTSGGTGISGSSANPRVRINGGSVSLNYPGDIIQTGAAPAVDINAMTGGSSTFAGNFTANTSTANAIDLTSNTGATITFQGDMDIDTTTANGFNVTGGGTVNATGVGSTATVTSTGRAINIDSTTIGGSGVTFRSVTATTAAGVPGIDLNNTGAGTFTVTGDGTTGGTLDNSNNGSGGTISNRTGNANAIELTNAGPVVIQQMTIGAAGAIGNVNGNGVLADASTSLTVRNTDFINVADQAAAPEEAAILVINPDASMNVTLANNLFERSFDDHVRFENARAGMTNGLTMGTIAVTANRFNDNDASGSGNDAVLYVGENSSFATITVQSNSFFNSDGDHVQIALAGTADVEATVGGAGGLANSTTSNGAGNVLGSGMTFNAAQGLGATNFSGDPIFRIVNNDIQDSVGGGAINGNMSPNTAAAGVFHMTMDDNIVGTDGDVFSGGAGVRNTQFGAGDFRVAADNNSIHEYDGVQGHHFRAGDGSGTMEATVTNNTVTDDSNGGHFFGVSVDVGGSAPDTTVVCFDADGNNWTGANGGFGDMGLGFTSGSGLEVILPGYAGGNTDNAAIAAHIAGNNPGAAIGSFAGGSNIVTGTGTNTATTCLAPLP